MEDDIDEWDEADESLTLSDVVIGALAWFVSVAVDAVIMFVVLCVANWFYQSGYTLAALAVLLAALSRAIKDAIRPKE